LFFTAADKNGSIHADNQSMMNETRELWNVNDDE